MAQDVFLITIRDGSERLKDTNQLELNQLIFKMACLSIFPSITNPLVYSRFGMLTLRGKTEARMIIAAISLLSIPSISVSGGVEFLSRGSVILVTSQFMSVGIRHISNLCMYPSTSMQPRRRDGKSTSRGFFGKIVEVSFTIFE
jgi:hypothetical protein